MSWYGLSTHRDSRAKPLNISAAATNLWANAKDHLPRQRKFVLPEKLPPKLAAAIIILLSVGLWALIILAVRAAIG